MSLWYNFFDFPGVYNNIRYVLLGGKRKIFFHLKKAVDLQENETILDLGCGPGELSQLFSFGYIGMDISERYVKYAIKCYPSKTFVKGDALEGFREKVDKVLLSCFIHHLSDKELSIIFSNLQSVVGKRLVVLDAVPQRRNPVAWFLYKADRGTNIRSLNEQLDFVRESFDVEEFYTFRCLFYKLSVIIAKPKNLKE